MEAGWGAAMGYPGLILDDATDEIAVQILTSHDLPDHWARLDAFEGPGYRRRVAQCATVIGMIAANTYTLTED